MQRELEGPQKRRIRVHTAHGHVEGILNTSAGVSTMHYLNVVSSSQSFLTLQPPLACPHDWLSPDGPAAIATDSILFVVELSDFVPRPGDPHEAAQFRRTPVRLRLAQFVVDGFVHVAPGGTAISRLNHDRHPFLALTSVSVIGPDDEITAPFIAANLRYVAAVQEIVPETEIPVEEHAVDRAER
jgi:hypothetical protein